MEDRETLAGLIELYGITAESRGGGLFDKDGWQCRAYTVTLRRAGRGDGDHENNPAPNWPREEGLETPYYMGTAHTDAPTALDVLAALLSDAETVDNAPYFEDWATELGYDTDSRKAEAIFDEVVFQRDALWDFLSDRIERGARMRGEHYERFMAAERP